MASLLLVCSVAVSASAENEASKLRGRWRATSAMQNGRPTKTVVGHLLIFKGETFVIRGKDGSLLYEGTYVVQPDESPPTIDFKHSGGKLKGTVWKGIYEQKSDRLRICDNAPDTKKRPKRLEAPRDSGYILVTFDRVK